jgi:phosphatidate phosphatase APP1
MPRVRGPITPQVFADALGLKGAARQRAERLVQNASGPDGRLARSDLEQLPDDLRLAWVEFQDQPVPHKDAQGGFVFANRIELEAAQRSNQLGVISDIDKTILPPHEGDASGQPYPGMRTLLQTIEVSGDGQGGDTFYVTARNEARAESLPQWMAKEGLPQGSIDTGVGGEPWLSHPEKVRDIERILAARPGQRFILFGDDNHTDPYVYRDIMRAYPERIAAAVIHRHRGTDLSRVPELIVVENYAQAAEALGQKGLLTEEQVDAVRRDAEREGLVRADN